MTPGDRCRVYKMPINKENYVGTAQLMKKVSRLFNGLEVWDVVLNGRKMSRVVDPKDKVTENDK